VPSSSFSSPSLDRGTNRALIIALLALALHGCGTKVPAQPSFVLLTLDTTRADYLGCYGRSLDVSPTIDSLAEEGALFELCIATAAVTPVSHASILTGLNPYQHGLRVLSGKGGDCLPADVPTLAEVLRAAGWRTGAFLSAFPVSERFGLDRGFDRFDSGYAVPADDPDAQRIPSKSFDGSQRRADLTAEKALQWLREDGERPFFLWLHFFDPHDPNLIPPLEAGQELAREFSATRLAPGEKRPSLYDIEIRYADEQLGAIVEHLRKQDRLESTVLLATADHGEGLGDHGWHGHRLLYQEQIRVPLVLRIPRHLRGGKQGGKRVGELVRTIDIFPTLLELADLTPPKPVEGLSLLPLIEGASEAPRHAYADQLNVWDENAKVTQKRPLDDLLHCVMDRRWKLIYRPLHEEQSELYDLQSDPAESVNLYASHPAERERLLAELKQRQALRLEAYDSSGADADSLRALRELGYIGDEGD
jgi:arylsulfatase A-like enzyme